MRFYECLTPQELLLLDSVPGETDPYKPVGVAMGTMSVEECDQWRQKVGFLEGCSANFFGYRGWARLTLEPLITNKKEDYGRTVRDPQLLIISFSGDKERITPASFPFKRGRHKLKKQQ